MKRILYRDSKGRFIKKPPKSIVERMMVLEDAYNLLQLKLQQDLLKNAKK